MAALSEIALWGIHAGRTGDADTLFHGHNVVALGWPGMGDLRDYSRFAGFMSLSRLRKWRTRRLS